MPKSFKSWSPCWRHNWEPIEGQYGLFRCKEAKCLVKGYQKEAIDPDFNEKHKTKIQPYTCFNSDCSNPTLEKGRPCPACKNKAIAGPKNPNDSLTPKQHEVMVMLRDNDGPMTGDQSSSRVFDSLHKRGLVLKKVVTLWSLSKKGERVLSREEAKE